MSDPKKYTVGWICAILTEFVAAQAFLDERHEQPKEQDLNDSNNYVLGRIAHHNVVIACLPGGEYGTASAAGVAINLLRSFPNIRIGLMVGIGGGAPTKEHDIRLGDVVISMPGNGRGGVFQYDFGKTVQGQAFVETGFLNQPPEVIRTAIQTTRAKYELDGHNLVESVNKSINKKPKLRKKYSYPTGHDILYKSDFTHCQDKLDGCEACGSNPSVSVVRPERGEDEDNPAIHYGLIASANRLIKDALLRDKLAKDKGILCFEMEAAGLMNRFPCLVIRGICDYSDTHKSKEWQGFAAMMAAAYAKDLLHQIPLSKIESEKTIHDKLSSMEEGIKSFVDSAVQDQTRQHEMRQQADNDKRCLRDLLITNPREDKKRIQDTKGGLLLGSCKWIFRHDSYLRFLASPQSHLLWIKGDPGKGKTMLLCGIITELEKSASNLLCYFFCQATETHLSNATSVLRGLLYLLLMQRPSLISYLRARYDVAGEKLFQGPNTWVTLVNIFVSMLQDPISKDVILIVDALDECVTDRTKLLHLMMESLATYDAKWLISSRTWPNTEQKLQNATQMVRLDLELNQDSVSEAVEAYIKYQVNQLAVDKEYDEETRDAVENYLSLNANSTFLWVALVCQELADPEVHSWHTRQKLTSFPSGLESIYGRMMDKIQHSNDASLYNEILAIASVVYRPITLQELKAISKLFKSFTLGELEKVVAYCGSFLTLRKGVIYFVHQSAKDYLMAGTPSRILPDGPASQHHAIFSSSMAVLSDTLKHDIFNLGAPGCSVDQILRPNPDPLASVRYQCVHWVDHFGDSGAAQSIGEGKDMHDSETIYTFIREKYLYWLESLSLLHCIPDGIKQVQKLQAISISIEAGKLAELLQDAYRFVLYHRPAIEIAPLQIYTSALIFSPSRSPVRKCFKEEEPRWVTLKPSVKQPWTVCLQTLEGHRGSVRAVAFSPVGNMLASASEDNTVRVWDANTGKERQRLQGHNAWVWAVAFSANGKLLASASQDHTIRLWDAVTGEEKQKLNYCWNTDVSFSPDSKLLASSSEDGTIQLWDTMGEKKQKLVTDDGWINAIAFSPDCKTLISASENGIIRLWDVLTGQTRQKLKSHDEWARAIAFSRDGKMFASGSKHGTIQLWDAANKEEIQKFEGHNNSFISAIAFSPDGKMLASSSMDKPIRLWDIMTGKEKRNLEGHSDVVWAVAFSPDGKTLASASDDKTIRLWDVMLDDEGQTLDGRYNSVVTTAFAPDGKTLVSALDDDTIKLWNAATGQAIQEVGGPYTTIDGIAFSPDSKTLASALKDNIIYLWSTTTGQERLKLEGHDSFIWAVAFAPGGNLLASCSSDGTILIWNVATGQTIRQLEVLNRQIFAIVFSPDGRTLASASDDYTIRIWELKTGKEKQKLESHNRFISAIVFSPDGKSLASASDDQTIRLWDAATGKERQIFEGRDDWVRVISLLDSYYGWVTAMAFSLDCQTLASVSNDLKMVRLWDTRTGGLKRTLQIDQPLHSLSFAEGNRYLKTNRGLLTLNPTRVSPQRSPDHGVFFNEDWVVQDGRKILWLPPDYRSSSMAAYNNTFALGLNSGLVTFIQFAM